MIPFCSLGPSCRVRQRGVQGGRQGAEVCPISRMLMIPLLPVRLPAASLTAPQAWPIMAPVAFSLVLPEMRPGIRLSGWSRELTSLAIWRCVLTVGSDTDTQPSPLYLRKMALGSGPRQWHCEAVRLWEKPSPFWASLLLSTK